MQGLLQFNFNLAFISVKYSLWFGILCLLLGICYALLLYRKDRQTINLSKTIKSILFALRTTAVTIIAFLLLKPIINTKGQHLENPTIIYLQDVSESVIPDTNEINQFKTETKKLLDDLKSKFSVREYSFGEYLRDSVDYAFKDKQTNMSEALSKINADWYNRNVGAVVISGDGIFNTGSNPMYVAKQLNVPLYTIALGNTEAKKDLILKDVEYNKIVFLNDLYPLRISIEAKKLKGQSTKLKIFDNGTLIHSETVKITNDDFFKVVVPEAKAKKSGIHRLNLQLDILQGEFSVKNNKKSILFEVIDRKQNVLILANSPHPDIAAINRALKNNKNFEVDFAQIGRNKKPLSAYNLVIMHQLPSMQNSALPEIQSIRKNRIPVVWIIGKQSQISKFNTAVNGVKIKIQSNSFEGTQGVLNPDFALFELMPETNQIGTNAPPLERPFGKFEGLNTNETVFFGKIKDVETRSPLVAFHTDNTGVKNCIITGEGIWRWRIYDYKTHKNNILFDEWIQKSCRYLSLKADKERFRVKTENIITENNDVIFYAERYNKSYELVNDDEVKLEIKNSSDTKLEYTFDKNNRAYKINIGKLAADDYKWKATTHIDGKTASKSGEFSISEINSEAQNTQANHQVLLNMSEQTGGKMLLFKDKDKLTELLLQNKGIKPVAHTEKKSYNIIHNKLLFFLILLLLTAEWFMRKYTGSF